MTSAETEDRHVVARRVFDALCARFPDKYVALIQPRSVAGDQPLSGRAELDPPSVRKLSDEQEVGFFHRVTARA